MKEIIAKKTNEIFNDIVSLRRDFHQHPELSYEEHRTSSIVANYLKEIGIEVKTGVAGTGVIGVLKGKNPSTKTIAFRADMDALPMQEETKHNFPSKVPNVMHACGHDAHTSILMGVATVLSSIKDKLNGSVMFIFQPAEEKLPGGALPMIKEGIFNPLPDSVFGLHCIPQVPVGKIGFYTGAMMAATDELYITVRGIGGHASAPQRTKDPIIASIQIISSLQSIISRNFPPNAPGVLSITAIHGGTATNIVPNEVKIMGTLRTMDEEIRKFAYTRLRDIIDFTAKAMGVEAELEIRNGYPVLINHKEETEFARSSAMEYLGEENVVTPEAIMGAEDFAYFLQKAKGSFWQLGVGNASKDIIHNIHSSQFDIDEEAIRVGVGFTSYLASKKLPLN